MYDIHTYAACTNVLLMYMCNTLSFFKGPVCNCLKHVYISFCNTYRIVRLMAEGYQISNKKVNICVVRNVRRKRTNVMV